MGDYSYESSLAETSVGAVNAPQTTIAHTATQLQCHRSNYTR